MCGHCPRFLTQHTSFPPQISICAFPFRAIQAEIATVLLGTPKPTRSPKILSEAAPPARGRSGLHSRARPSLPPQGAASPGASTGPGPWPIASRGQPRGTARKRKGPGRGRLSAEAAGSGGGVGLNRWPPAWPRSGAPGAADPGAALPVRCHPGRLQPHRAGPGRCGVKERGKRG